jgi:kynurenine formamidase
MTTAATADQQRLEELYDQCSNWGRWGATDELGALNLLTSEHRIAAATLVRSGESLSLANDLSATPNAEHPFPAHHHMLASGDALDSNGIPGYEATRDYVGTDVHGLGVTHIDALCHMFAKGRTYNDRGPETVRSTGATANTVMSAADGIVGRGVLLDIARSTGVDALPGNTAVTPDLLDAAEVFAGVTVGAGDLLLVGTGRDRRRRDQRGRFDPITDGTAGLHHDCLPWLRDRDIAMLGSDGISDPMPGLAIPEWPFPIHQIAITRLGLMLIDNLNLLTLGERCAEADRWEFLLTVAPLRIPGGTGCPVNPIAVL